MSTGSERANAVAMGCLLYYLIFGFPAWPRQAVLLTPNIQPVRLRTANANICTPTHATACTCVFAVLGELDPR